MLSKNSIKRYNRQILAMVEKEFFLQSRIKSNFIFRFLNPVIELLLLIFVFGIIFNIKEDFSLGYWNVNNYILFLILAFSIQFSKSVMSKYYELFMYEKYWKTISAIMVAPVHRFTLLISVLISELVMNFIPLFFLFMIAIILFPIPFINILLVFLVFFCIFFIFSSIGLIIGVFTISHEELVPYIQILLRFIFLFSCTNYPKEIFPDIIQDIVVLNPFYYIFDLLRISWYLGVDYETAIRLVTPTHIIVISVFTIITPMISIYLFNRIYKKRGISGY